MTTTEELVATTREQTRIKSVLAQIETLSGVLATIPVHGGKFREKIEFKIEALMNTL